MRHSSVWRETGPSAESYLDRVKSGSAPAFTARRMSSPAASRAEPPPDPPALLRQADVAGPICWRNGPAELGRLGTARLRQPAGPPAGGDALLIVLGGRMRFVDEFNGQWRHLPGGLARHTRSWTLKSGMTEVSGWKADGRARGSRSVGLQTNHSLGTRVLHCRCMQACNAFSGGDYGSTRRSRNPRSVHARTHRRLRCGFGR